MTLFFAILIQKVTIISTIQSPQATDIKNILFFLIWLLNALHLNEILSLCWMTPKILRPADFPRCVPAILPCSWHLLTHKPCWICTPADNEEVGSTSLMGVSFAGIQLRPTARCFWQHSKEKGTHALGKVLF